MTAYLDHAKNELSKIKDHINKGEIPSITAKIFIRNTYVKKYGIQHDLAAHAALLWYIRVPDFNTVIGELIETVIDYKMKSLMLVFEFNDISDIDFSNQETRNAFLDLNKQAHVEI